MPFYAQAETLQAVLQALFTRIQAENPEALKGITTSKLLLRFKTTAPAAEVALNGKPLGVRWYGRHIYDGRDALKQGKNTLEIKVTTVLSNYLRSLKDNPNAMRFGHWYQPKPAGLVGPVRLVREK